MENRNIKRLIMIAFVFVLIFTFAGCTPKGGEDAAEEAATDTNISIDASQNGDEDFWVNEVDDFKFDEYMAEFQPDSEYIPSEGLPVVKISIQDGEDIVLELYPESAPNTVNNFLALSRSGFYDGLIFHRIIVDFMVQGGDPLGAGTGNPGYSIDGEFSNNGFDNDLSHTPGVISMARSRDFNSAGSQFFIVHGDATFLDGDYAAFGKVIYGFEEVDRIANVKTGKGDKPEEDVVMESIRVDLNGYEFSKPVVNK